MIVPKYSFHQYWTKKNPILIPELFILSIFDNFLKIFTLPYQQVFKSDEKVKKAKSTIEIQGVEFQTGQKPGCGSFHTIHTVGAGPAEQSIFRASSFFF